MTAAESVAALRAANPPAGQPDAGQDQAPTNGHSSPLPVNGKRFLPQRRPGAVLQSVQAANIQRFTYDALMSLQTKLKGEDGKLDLTRDDAMAIAQLGRAWDTARDAVRILRGKGLPAAVRSKSSSSAGPVEPMNPA